MLKPLVLTIHPLDPSFPKGYNLPRDTRITYRMAGRMGKEKHLTLAELAAEYWRAAWDDSEACEKGSAWMETDTTWFDGPQDCKKRAEVLERFAALPHYNEEVTQ